MISRRDIMRAAACAVTGQLSQPLRALAAAAGRVRITNVESYRVLVPTSGADREGPQESNYAVTRVHTDAGITGTSFIACPAEILERWVKPTLVGDDLFAV